MKKYILASLAILLAVVLNIRFTEETEVTITQDMMDYETLYTLGIEKLINDNTYLDREARFILLRKEELDKLDDQTALRVMDMLSQEFDIPFYDADETEMEELGLGNNLYTAGGAWIFIESFYLDRERNRVIMDLAIGDDPLGAEGYSITFMYKDDGWIIEAFNFSWIS